MTPLRWPNVERAVVAWLAALLGVKVYSETPKTLPTAYVVVERSGGADSAWISKEVDVEVRVVAATRGALWDLVGDVESAMWSLGASATPNGVYVDLVNCPFGFAYDPPASQEVRRATATFTLTVRPSA